MMVTDVIVDTKGGAPSGAASAKAVGTLPGASRVRASTGSGAGKTSSREGGGGGKGVGSKPRAEKSAGKEAADAEAETHRRAERERRDAAAREASGRAEREARAQVEAQAERERAAAAREAERHARSNPGQAGGGAAGSGFWGKKEPRNDVGDVSGPEYAVLDHLKVTDEATQLVTHKKQFVFFNETEGHSMLRHWLEYEDGNETLIYHFPRSLFELLPLEEPKWKFDTCAIVGNSGITLLKEYGQEIDAHDAVIRINMAPTHGFEPYVGKKTTFDVVNAHNVREILQGVRKWRPATEGDTRLVLFETASHFARYHLCQPLLKKYSQENALLLNPIFSNRAHKLWVQLKALLERKHDSTYNRKPMSGFFAVLFALQMCDHVNLYGFDAYTSRKRSYRYHYFDNVQGFTDVHSFDLAIEVYKLIAKRGGLTINM